MPFNARTRDKAAGILSGIFGDEPEPSSGSDTPIVSMKEIISAIPDLAETDDIAESGMYRYVVNEILGRQSSTVNVSLPFEKFAPFDPSVDTHEFVITSRTVTPKTIGKTLASFSELFELAEWFRTSSEKMTAAYSMNSCSGVFEQMAEEGDDVLDSMLKSDYRRLLVGEAFDRFKKAFSIKTSEFLELKKKAEKLKYRGQDASMLPSTTDTDIRMVSSNGADITQPSSFDPPDPISTRYVEGLFQVAALVRRADLPYKRREDLTADNVEDWNAFQHTGIDCSRFVHKVYQTIGLDYKFAPTYNLVDSPYFQPIPEKDARVGDLYVLRAFSDILPYAGHVMIITNANPESPNAVLHSEGGWSRDTISGDKRGGVHFSPKRYPKLYTDLGYTRVEKWYLRYIGKGQRQVLPASYMNDQTTTKALPSMKSVTIMQEDLRTFSEILASLSITYQNIITPLINTLLSAARTTIQKTVVNDVTGKVSSLALVINPSSTILQPMEGESAPIAQTLGGRNVRVTARISFKEPTEIIKLFMLFGVASSSTTVASLMYLARNARNGENESAYRYLRKEAEDRRISDVIDEISGKTVKPDMIEPISIRNNYLNSLGLYEFFPTDLEVTTVGGSAGEFLATITFMYLNVRNRRLESLRKEKRKGFKHSLPVMGRLCMYDVTKKASEPIDLGSEDPAALNEKEKFYTQVSLESTIMGLADLLPMYCMYRVATLVDQIRSAFPMNGSDSHMLDLTDPVAASMIRSLAGTYDSVDAILNSRALSATKNLLSSRGWRAVDTVAEIAPAVAQLVLAIGLPVKGWYKGKITAVKTSTTATKEAKAMAAAEERYSQGKAILTGSLATATGAGMVTGILATPTDDEGVLSFNIAALMPVLMFDLVREFLIASEKKEENQFFNAIASRCLDYIANSEETASGLTQEFPLLVRHNHSNYPEKISEQKFSKVSISISDPDETVKVSSTVISGIGKQAEDIRKMAARAFNTVASSDATPMKIMGSLEYGSALLMEYLVVSAYSKLMLYSVTPEGKELPEIDSKTNLLYCHPIYKTAMATTNHGSLRDFFGDVLMTTITFTGADIQAYETLKDIGKRALGITMPTQNDIDSLEKATNPVDGVITKTYFRQAMNTREDTSVKAIEDAYRVREDVADALLADIREAGMIIVAADILQEEFSGFICDRAMSSMNSPVFTRGAMRAIGLKIATMGRFIQGSQNEIMHYTGIAVTEVINAETIINDMVPGYLTRIANSVARAILVILGPMVIEVFEFMLGFAAGRTKLALLAMMSRLVGMIGTVVALGQFAFFILESLLTKTVEYIMGIGSLCRLGEWMYAQVAAGSDATLACSLCIKAQIWLPSIANLGETFDDADASTYCDYPMVKIGGTIAAPDLFVSKVGETLAKLNDAIELNERMTEIATEETGGYTIENFSEMAKRALDETKNITIMQRNDLKQTIAAAIVPDTGTIAVDIPSSTRTNLRGYIPLLQKTITKVLNKDEIIYIVKAESKQDNVSKGAGCYTITLTDEGELDIFIPTDIELFKSRTNPGSAFGDLVMEMNNRAAGTLPPEMANRLADAIRSDMRIPADDRAVAKPYLIGIATKILSHIAVHASFVREKMTPLSAMTENVLPGTLGNMLMLSKMMGNSMRVVGKAGSAYFKENLKAITYQDLLEETLFRSSYNFPAFRVFFIEEDDEAYYMWDDLYSYSAIISIKVTEDDTSALQTCVITASNVYGALTNIVTDAHSSEMFFLQGGDEQSEVNAIFLKPGCKIRVQAGYSPVLSDRDVMFTGRINSVTPGEIVTITADGHGAVMYTEISKENIVPLTGHYFADEQMAAARATEIVHPKSRLIRIISELMSKLTAESSLSDYTIDPTLTITAESGVTNIATNYDGYIKSGIMKALSSKFTGITGINFNFYYNAQLMENIHVRKSDADDTYSNCLVRMQAESANSVRRVSTTLENFLDIPAWICYNETGWDVMQEINLMLPGYHHYVRPFDTRGTLVWGRDDTYYRTTRATSLDSIACDTVLSRIEQMRDALDTTDDGGAMLDLMESLVNSGTEDNLAAVEALITTIAFYAQKQYAVMYYQEYEMYNKSLLRPIDSTYEMASDFTNNTNEIAKAEGWLGLYPSGDSIRGFRKGYEETIGIWNKGMNEAAGSDTTQAMSRMEVGVYDIYQNGVKGHKWPPEKVTESIMKNPSSISIHSGIATPVMICLIFKSVSEHLLEYFYSMAAMGSRSYRRMSAVHTVYNGRDIIKNNIQLCQAPNTVMLTVPDSGDKVEELVTPDVHGSPYVIRAHYKLKPYVINSISSHFKNPNAFPNARPAAISTVAGSILANSLSSMYGGNIEILGRSRMRAGDRIIINDEVNDLFGSLRAGKVTTVISAIEGYKTTIEPRMLTRTTGLVRDSFAITMLNSAKQIAIAGVIGYVMFKSNRLKNRMLDRLSMSAALGKSRPLKIASAAANVAGRPLSTASQYAMSTKPLISIKNLASTTWKKITDSSKGFTKVRFLFRKGLDDARKYGEDTETALEAMIASPLAHSINDSASSFVVGIKAGVDKVSREQCTVSVRHVLDSLALRKKIGDFDSAKYVDNMTEFVMDAMSESVGPAMKRVISGRRASNGVMSFDDLTTDELEKIYAEMHKLVLTRLTGKYRKKIGIMTLDDDDIKTIVSNIMYTNPFGVAQLSDTAEEAARFRMMVDEFINDNTNKLFGDFRNIAIHTVEGSGGAIKTEAANAAASSICIETVFGGQRTWGDITRIGKAIIGGAGAYWMVESLLTPVHEFSEWEMVMTDTADKLVLSPLFFRGEPFIAGLDGMTKGDAQDAGLGDILKPRLSDYTEMFSHIDDSIDEGLYRMMYEKAKASNLAK